jgi:hypothetical protein
MPCYQIQYVSVEFKARNVDLIEAAAKQLGWSFVKGARYINVGSVTIDLETQTARVESYNQSSLNKLKQAYSLRQLQR